MSNESLRFDALKLVAAKFIKAVLHAKSIQDKQDALDEFLSYCSPNISEAILSLSTLEMQLSMANGRARIMRDPTYLVEEPKKPSLADPGTRNGVVGMPDNWGKGFAHYKAMRRTCIETVAGYQHAASMARTAQEKEQALCNLSRAEKELDNLRRQGEMRGF